MLLLPIRSKNPPESLPIGTCCLIGLNLLLFLLTQDGGEIRKDVLEQWGLKATNSDLPHMFSSMFLHANVLHILGNMWFLYLFGFAVEGRLKTFKFLMVYLAAGLCGDGLDLIYSGAFHPNVPSLGASGAVMGVMGAALYLFPHAKVSMFYGIIFRWGVADWPMWGVGLFFILFDNVLPLLLRLEDGVGHFAHLGGVLGGFLLCIPLRPRRDSARASEAKATLSETKHLGYLQGHQLGDLHKANPEDPLVVLHWMDQSLRSVQGPGQEVVDAYFKLLPRMLKELDILPVASSLLNLMRFPGMVRSRELLEAAARVERAGEPTLAMSLYEATLQSSGVSASDLEIATFRIAVLCDGPLKNPARSAQCYQEIITKWPMGPFADQAKARLGARSPV